MNSAFFLLNSILSAWRGPRVRPAAYPRYWVVTIVICLAQMALFLIKPGDWISLGMMLALVWLLSVLFAIGAAGPRALWLFLTLPFGAPLLSFLFYLVLVLQ